MSQNPNPQKTVGNRPLSQHISNFTLLPGYLQHAPYSFKTVGQALNWLRTTFPSTSGKYLPWTNPQTNKTIQYLVIQCLPGLYGPTLGPSLVTDPYSGMNWNGETFPLEIPQRVSLQGASALDTIFDARSKETGGTNTSILRIHWTNPLDGHEFQYTFVDNLTLRGARGDGTIGAGGARTGAAILIDDEAPANPSITNCIFTDNTVGIGIWSDRKEPNMILHQPIIANNTFAWNQVGLWNGSSYDTPSKGRNKPIVINNIFDTAVDSVRASATTGFNLIIGVSAFEGLDVSDRLISSRNGASLNVDSNAYEISTPRRTNLGDILTAPPLSWPRTTSRSSGGPYNPVVQIQAYTQPGAAYGSPSAGRRVLYINDAFWRHVLPHVRQVSQSDFRIAPYAESTSGWGVNPLINAGVDFGYNSAARQPIWTGLIIFGNGRSLTQAPGLPPAAAISGPEDIAQLNGWDWDMDGHGNPRIADRRFATKRPSNPSDSRIDLGADESGELTISGFLTNTRIFSRQHISVAANTAGFPKSDGLYFFNIYHGVGNPNNIYDRPWYNFLADIKYTTPFPRLPGSEWFKQILVNPYATTSSVLGNYTDGRFDTRPYSGNNGLENLRLWFQTYVPSGGLDPRKPQPPFMRNLACDLSPHLVHDLPPNVSNPDQWWIWWGERFDHHRPGSGYPGYRPHSPVYDDIFKANPWFNNTYNVDAQWTDNPSLFYDSQNTKTWNLLGHVAPPLTLPQNTLLASTKSYLFLNSLHAWLWWDPGTTHTYTILSTGVSAPDPLPFYTGSDWHGLRINMELVAPDDAYWTQIGVPRNNLQTFLTVESDVPPVESFQGESTTPAKNLGIEGKARREMKAFLKKRALEQRK